MTDYYGVIGNRDYIKRFGEKRPFWEYLDRQPDGWLTSLAYNRKDLPSGKRMIFDCGAWTYKDQPAPALGKNAVTPLWAFDQYKQIASSSDFIVAPDHMLLPGYADLDSRREINSRYAVEFLEVAGGSPFVPMAVAHGLTLAERIERVGALVDLGYSAISLGGMAGRASAKRENIAAAQAIRSAFPSVWLHVLGLSSPDYFKAWHDLGVNSCDGSSHFKQAFTAGAFFTQVGAKLTKHAAARTDRETGDLLDQIVAPACDCTACGLLREEGIDTRQYGSNENNMGRAAHNLNMLMRAQAAAIQPPPVFLVSCVGEKLDHAAPAKDLYQSAWFKKAREYVEARGRWFVLSALLGLVDPDSTIDPYNATLNDMSAAERREWAGRVFVEIERSIPVGDLVVMAGRNYRDYLIPLLVAAGYSVSVPLENLGIGEQLSWFNSHNSAQTDQLSLL